jgi:hypothetical protein
MKGERLPVVRSTFAPTAIRARTADVVAVDRNPEIPKRPLHVLIPAGIVALVAFAAMIFVCVKTWYLRDVEASAGIWLLVITGAAFMVAIFGFNYAWELYDTRKALRRTIVMCLIGFAAVVVVGVVLAMLASDGDADFDVPGLGSKNAAAPPVPVPAPSESSGSAASRFGSWGSNDIDINLDFGRDDERPRDSIPEIEPVTYETQAEREARKRKAGQPIDPDGTTT